MDENSRYCNNRTIKYSEIGMPCPSVHYCLGDCMQNYWLSPSSSNCYSTTCSCHGPEGEKLHRNVGARELQVKKLTKGDIVPDLLTKKLNKLVWPKTSQVKEFDVDSLFVTSWQKNFDEKSSGGTCFWEKLTKWICVETKEVKKHAKPVSVVTFCVKKISEPVSAMSFIPKIPSKIVFDKTCEAKVFSENFGNMTFCQRTPFEGLGLEFQSKKHAERSWTGFPWRFCSLATTCLFHFAVQRCSMAWSSIPERTPVAKVAAWYLSNSLKKM